MILLTALKYFKDLPEKWVICLTILLFPILNGLGSKLSHSGDISVNYGEAQIKVGQIQEVARTGDRQSEVLLDGNQKLIESFAKLQKEVAQNQIKLDAMGEVREAIARNDNAANDLAVTHEEIADLSQDIVEEIAEEVTEEKQSFLGRWLTAKRGKNA